MNIACVIREQRRWGLNGLLSGPLNTGSTMERQTWQRKQRRGGRGQNTDRTRAEGEGGRKLEDGKDISESKGKEKLLDLLLADTAGRGEGRETTAQGIEKSQMV